MNVLIYSRVFTKKQDTDNQISELQDFCIKSNWTIYKIYKDVVSGTKNEKSLDEILKLASQKKFDLLLFWSLDRLSRSGAFKTISFLKQLDSYSVRFKSFQEPYFDSTGIFKDVLISIISTIAEQEKIRISERVHAGLKNAREKGVVLGRPTIKTELIKEIKHLYKHGCTISEVARRKKIDRKTIAKYIK